jgi:hypothetical protein
MFPGGSGGGIPVVPETGFDFGKIQHGNSSIKDISAPGRMSYLFRSS